jgi:pilus assembly protein CpaB
MNKAQIALLGVSLASGALAFYLFQPSEPPPAQMQQQAAPAPVVTMDEILVARAPLEFGSTITDQNVGWQQWPANVPLDAAIKKKDNPKAIEDMKGSVVRGAFMVNEPIRKERLVKGANANFMATLVAPGKRAVAINVDSSGATTAGNFILPNDRVDIVRTYRDEELAKLGSGDAMASEVIFRNVKVLAIGPNVQNQDGKPVVTGTNATLELDPRQAEYVILAQRTGQLSLVLRNLTDALQNAEVTDNQNEARSDKSLSIVRFGVTTTLRAK